MSDKTHTRIRFTAYGRREEFRCPFCRCWDIDWGGNTRRYRDRKVHSHCYNRLREKQASQLKRPVRWPICY